MSSLPDELWRQILDIGIRNSNLTYKDLCCISISCRRLRRLSNEDSFWSYLLLSDFPTPQQQNHCIATTSSSSASASAKFTYRVRFEKERERKVAAHRRAVLRKESQVLELQSRIGEIETLLLEETEKLRDASTQLSNLLKVRQASVALNVWQPQVVRGRHKQIVEQCTVPVESRVHSLEMELKLCRQQIAGLNKAYRDENRRLETAMEELASMKYHPLRDHILASNEDNECNKKRKMERSIKFPGRHGKT